MPARQRQDVRAWLAAVLDFAKAKGWRSWDAEEGNPAKFEDERRHLWPAAPKKKDAKNHPALPWSEVPALMAKLSADSSDTARALAWTILNAVRTGDVEGATWSQVQGDIWTIPVAKNGDPLRVPLTAATKKLLGKSPSRNLDAPLFNLRSNAMRGLLDTFGLIDPKLGRKITVHGFRSSFRDWCGENGKNRDLAEMALGHKVGSDVERRYARSDLLKLRRDLMLSWSDFATGN